MKDLKLNSKLRIKLDDAEKDKDELYKKLQRHDLTRKAIRKPGLMEKIFNKGTQKEFKDLEDITKRPEVN